MGLIRGSQVMRIVTTALLHGRPAVEKHEPVLRAPFDQELPELRLRDASAGLLAIHSCKETVAWVTRLSLDFCLDHNDTTPLSMRPDQYIRNSHWIMFIGPTVRCVPPH